MAMFQCRKCKYSFNPRSGNTALPKRCPYCSAEGAVMRMAKADDLIRNVDDMLELGYMFYYYLVTIKESFIYKLQHTNSNEKHN